MPTSKKSNKIIAPPLKIAGIDIDVEAVKDAMLYINNNTGHDMVDRQIEEFIHSDEDSGYVESKQLEFSGRSYVGWAHSLMTVCERYYEVEKVCSYNGRGTAEANPIYLDEKVRSRDGTERIIKVPHRQTRFLRHRENGHPLVLYFYPYEMYEIDCRVYFGTNSNYNHVDFMDEVNQHFKTEKKKKNAVINADYTFLEVPKMDWNDIVLTKDQQSLIDRHAINFLDRMEDYKELGMRTSRGLLLLGPPGTGKTLCCSILINLCQDCTIIYVSRNAIQERGQIDEIYGLARKLSPALVVVEDIDTLGGIDREQGDHPLLGEFLNCLAGVEKNEGVITLATTNYANHLDWALADRPGRFDIRVHFDHPDVAARALILEKYLDKCRTDELDLKSMVKKTDGWSGAYLRELVNIAIMLSADQDKIITQEIFDQAQKELSGMRTEVAKERGRTRKEDKTQTDVFYG